MLYTLISVKRIQQIAGALLVLLLGSAGCTPNANHMLEPVAAATAKSESPNSGAYQNPDLEKYQVTEDKNDLVRFFLDIVRGIWQEHLAAPLAQEAYYATYLKEFLAENADQCRQRSDEILKGIAGILNNAMQAERKYIECIKRAITAIDILFIQDGCFDLFSKGFFQYILPIIACRAIDTIADRCANEEGKNVIIQGLETLRKAFFITHQDASGNNFLHRLVTNQEPFSQNDRAQIESVVYQLRDKFPEIMLQAARQLNHDGKSPLDILMLHCAYPLDFSSQAVADRGGCRCLRHVDDCQLLKKLDPAIKISCLVENFRQDVEGVIKILEAFKEQLACESIEEWFKVISICLRPSSSIGSKPNLFRDLEYGQEQKKIMKRLMHALQFWLKIQNNGLAELPLPERKHLIFWCFIVTNQPDLLREAWEYRYKNGLFNDINIGEKIFHMPEDYTVKYYNLVECSALQYFRTCQHAGVDPEGEYTALIRVLEDMEKDLNAAA